MTYQDILLTCGYNAASLYSYIINVARDGKLSTTTTNLANITGLSVKQIRNLLSALQGQITWQIKGRLGANGGIDIIIDKSTICTSQKNKAGRIKGELRANKKNIKESTFFPPPNVPPITPSLSPPIIPQETHTLSACEKFSSWLSQECPYIAAHLKPLTDVELDKLKQRFSTEDIMRVCHEIENRKDLRKRYTNLYRTLLNWLQRNENNRTTHPNTPTTKEQRLSQAEQLVYRLAREDGAEIWQQP